jgi:hypothetical protein
LEDFREYLKAFMLPGGRLLPFNPAMHPPSCNRMTVQTAATAFPLYTLVASLPVRFIPRDRIHFPTVA